MWVLYETCMYFFTGSFSSDICSFIQITSCFRVSQFVGGWSSCLFLCLHHVTAPPEGVVEGECVSRGVEAYKGLPEAGSEGGAEGGMQPGLQLRHQLLLRLL